MLIKMFLRSVIFPLQNLTKPEVRKIADDLGLVTAKKKDSTGICFIGERNFRQFLTNYLPNLEGDIVNIDTNEVLGRHIGLMYYTIGQRRGLNIGGYENRMFVVGKNLDKNELYVALGNDNPYLYSTSCLVDELNWLGDEQINSCTAKFRYRQADNDVKLNFIDDKQVMVTYPQGIKAVTKGQACVFYDGDVCLGGGIIKEIYKNGEKCWYL